MSEHEASSSQTKTFMWTPPVKPPRAESREILEAILIEQRQTNQLLALLIEALADETDQQDEEAEPTTYLDGTPRS